MNGLNTGDVVTYTALAVVVLFVIIVLVRSVRIVPQAKAFIVERLGRYSRTLDAGLHLLIPFFDRVRAGVDLREQVVSFPPQPVITSDNLVVSIDTVIYYQVTEPRSAVYEIANYIQGIEQLTVTTLRNVVGSMDLEQTLTSRDQINGQLRGVLDEATGRWGVRVNRVELKSIDPPQSIQGSMDLEQTLTSRDQINGQLRGVLDEATGRWGVRVNRVELKSIDPPQSIQGSMEQQMRAERDRRAAILTAEGVKQSQILTAEGEKQSAILRAEGSAQAAILNAEGESRAILQVFDAIHRGDADPKLLAYQYLQVLPAIARTESNKIWFVPTEFTAALGAISRGFGGSPAPEGSDAFGPARPAGTSPLTAEDIGPSALGNPADAVAQARAESLAATEDATRSGTLSGRRFDPSVEAGQHADEPPADSPA